MLVDCTLQSLALTAELIAPVLPLVCIVAKFSLLVPTRLYAGGLFFFFFFNSLAGEVFGLPHLRRSRARVFVFCAT